MALQVAASTPAPVQANASVPTPGVGRTEEGETSMSSGDVSVHRTVGIWGSLDEEDAQVVMALMWTGGKLGLAFYVVDSTHLHVMPDTAEADDFCLLRRVLLQVQPMAVVVSSTLDERAMRALEEYVHPKEAADGRARATVEVVPSSDFRVESSKRRILSVTNFPGVPADCSDEEKALRLSAFIPLASTNLVRSLGALLKYVEKKRMGVELEDPNIRVPIRALKTFSVDNLLLLDEDAYCSLQIFQKEAHPSVYKSGKGCKEGLSLFGLANKTKSPYGSKMLRLWFLRPLRDLESLQERQEAITFLVSPRNEEVVSTLHDCIKHIKFIPRILKRMNTAHASVSDWQTMYKTIYNSIYIGDICRTLSKEIAIFQKIAQSFTDDLQRLASLINRIVDFDESTAQQRFCVKPNVDTELDERKSLYHGLPSLLTTVAGEELERLGEVVAECSVIYLPQLGYLVAIPRSEVDGKGDELQQKELEFVFLSNNVAHFKSPKTRELDHVLGDIQCEIQDHETAIMHRLQGVILEHSQSLINAMELAGELDCLIALAVFAKQHNCVRPDLTEENVIYIKGGRHPLQELCVSPFVPNDTCLDLQRGRMKVLTGPNASGKSVYLKQVGLIVFLAQVGSFVPAEAAKIGLVDQIFTRIHTRESVSVALSTFMIDLNQVSLAVRESSERSLILLDEFGKGTATVDGVSLLAATLRHWLALGLECPNILVSTHFHSVIQQKLLPTTDLVEYLMMDFIRDGEELVFLYQLVPGTSDTSYACHVALMAGLPKELVRRGAEVSDLLRRNEPIPRTNTASIEEQYSRCELMVSKFLELDLERDDISSFLKEVVLPTAEGEP